MSEIKEYAFTHLKIDERAELEMLRLEVVKLRSTVDEQKKVIEDLISKNNRLQGLKGG
jgi:hypothetical protein